MEGYGRRLPGHYRLGVREEEAGALPVREKQELKRDLSVLSNFVFSFAIISMLTGVTMLYNTGLTLGGLAIMTFGWFVAGTFTMAVGLSMAEIYSSFPTFYLRQSLPVFLASDGRPSPH
ncbi:hypothetical protein GUJ93_ZPchr0015g6989 [Zizania palustris]|uniref:Uncharacterized protein n=1 Tax=Zizania palustris TaxID=103762 RepID=A0A8J5SYM4_ZIZPA|nr:hypothetical protein GUJ93_ZPchr0015g6989 [Zizania palustris]